jgi:hypothetical protein
MFAYLSYVVPKYHTFSIEYQMHKKLSSGEFVLNLLQRTLYK